VFDISGYTNFLHLDWGQNSYGAANGNDPSGWQRPLSFYCNDDSIDVLPIAFLTTFFGVGGEPQINLANVIRQQQQKYKKVLTFTFKKIVL
jgi:chitinase